MIDFKSIVISLPARELAHLAFRGSVFYADEILKTPLCPDLRLALEVVLAGYQGATPLRCVARPEMFTHGVPLAWLKTQLRGVSEHLSLSDGSVIKTIPEFRNHVFVYGLQSMQRQVVFKNLLIQAPELLSQCDSQVNSFHRTIVQTQVTEPPAQPLMMISPGQGSAVWFYGFYLNPHSVDDSVFHMMSWGDFEGSKLGQSDRVIYIPITECSLHDSVFQCYLADAILTAYFDPSVCLLIRLPPAGGDLPERLRLALLGIYSTRRRFPRVRSKNIFIVADDLSERSLRNAGPRLAFVLHHSFEYWRYTRLLYQSAAEVVFFFAQDRIGLSEMGNAVVSESLGKQPKFLAGDGSIGIAASSGY